MCAPGSPATTTMTIHIRDIDRMRLLVWELRMLHDRMRVFVNPEAAVLEGIITRFMADTDPDRAD